MATKVAVKRLFEVNGDFFSEKKVAKKFRGTATIPAHVKAAADGKPEKHVPAVYPHELKLGPDHWRRKK